MSSTVSGRSRLSAFAVMATLVAGLAPLASPGGVAAVVLDPPTLTSPAPGATLSENPVFGWTAVSGAVKYRIEVSTDAGFSPLVSGFPVDTLNLRYAPPAELPLGTLQWRVAALDAGNVVGTYAYGTFTKVLRAAPNVLTPLDGAVFEFPTHPLRFTWDALAGAQSYEFQVDDADDFIGATAYATKNTSYVITEPRTVGQTFYWRVRGVSGSIYSDWSPIASFSSVWPTKPELVHPEADATGVTDVYFDWNPVLGARTYQLQVSPNGDWAGNRTIDVAVKSTRYDPPLPLNNGNYFWRVRALDAASSANFGPWSDNEGVTGDERVFQRGWSATPAQVWPPDGGSTSPQDVSDTTWQNPTFSWTPARNASWYRVRFSTSPTMGSALQGCITNRTTWTPYLNNNQPTSGIGVVHPGSCSVSLAPGTTYYWDVAALDNPVLNSGVDVWGPPRQDNSIIGLRSAIRSFVYEPPAPLAGTVRQLAPGDYLTPARCDPAASCATFEADTPVFTWTAIPGATGYTVTVALDPNFTNVYRTYTTTLNRLAPRDSWRDNQANQAYYWNVTPSGLTLDIANRSVFQKRTEGVHRTSPAEAADEPNDFTMTWQDYLDTNQGLTPKVPQEAQEYRIRVSAVSDFATLIETRVVNTPFYTPFDKTYPEGPIYWQVQAIDGSDNDLTVSRVGGGHVKKTSPPPVQFFPPNAGSVTGVPYLQWLPLAYAASYDVQIDNDANFSSPVTTTTTKMTAWAYAEPLAAGTYHWRVRRNDADNRDGAWSNTWSFTLNPAAPTLVSPANGANPSPTSLLLQWAASQPAPRYTVELSTSAVFAGQVSGFPQTTVMSSWAPRTLLGNGTYYWRVRALNASGTSVAISSVFSFTIDSTRPSVASLSPASAAALNAAFTVTFSEPVTGVSGTTFVVTTAGTVGALPGTVSVLSPTSARFTPTGVFVPGQTVTISLSSGVTDLVGNPLLPYSANVRTSTTVQENSVAVREAWGRWTTASASGGAMKISRRASSRLTYTFSGTSVSLVGYRGPQGGYASVYLDGVLQTSSLSFYASANQYRRTLWTKTGLAAGPHTIQVVVRGTKPTASTSTWVYIDAFTVDGLTVQENAAGVVDAFRRVATSLASGSAFDVADHVSATGRSGPSLTFQFRGTGISWYGTKGPAYGKAYVFVDNVRRATIDLYRSSTAYRQKLWTSTTLTNGLHTIRIQVLGSKQAASKGYDVSFDYFTIR